MRKITCFMGDGIGPEITNQVIRIIDSLNLDLEFEKFDLGESSYQKCQSLIDPLSLESFKKNKVALKAPCTTPIGKGFRSVNVQLRIMFDLYSNIRPCKTIENINTRYDKVDLVTFRENTEDLYIGEEKMISKTERIAIKKTSYEASYRIIKAAFEYAVNNNRQEVCCVHKANILKLTDGYFLEIFNQVKLDYPSIKARDLIVDNTCMQLVINPNQFDVIVTSNLYGDIISDLTSGLIGGLGLLPSCNKNDEYAIYEAVHGSAPDIAGQDLANPTALLMSAIMMLKDIGYEKAGKKIEASLAKVYRDGKFRTRDLDGNSTLSEFSQAIIDNL